MEKLKVIDDFNGVRMDLLFSSSVNFLCGNSGTGKTFLMHAVELHCSNSSISCQYVDFRVRNKSEDYILSMCACSDIVLLDNADLYLTHNLYSKLRKQSGCLIISMKDRSMLDTSDTASYISEYKDMVLTVRRM